MLHSFLNFLVSQVNLKSVREQVNFNGAQKIATPKQLGFPNT